MYLLFQRLTGSVLFLSFLLPVSPMIHADTSAQMSDDALYFSWDGYRIARYRSPTPNEAQGGQRINTVALQALLQTREVALMDVQPVRWQDGIFLQTKTRYHLPGSVWLPNVGLGELDQHWTDYFRQGLDQVSQGNKDYPVVIYCTADCWMSWNAVKRAASWGYTQLLWYAEGTDGWSQAEFAMTPATPIPLEIEVQSRR